MISKEEAKTKLRKAGYSIIDDNSIITIVIPEKGNIKNTVKAVKELFLKIDYKASFGVKQAFVDGSELTADIVEDEPDVSQDDSPETITSHDTIQDITDISEDKDVAEVVRTNKKASIKKATKATKSATDNQDTLDKMEEDDYFDEEDDLDNSDGDINLNSLDMDMLLNEDSIQFSLEDFGMM